MAKVLILPLLTMSSGHHKVAETITKELIKDGHIVKTIDILSYTIGNLEKSITNIYKSILGMFPQSYEALYRFIAGPENYDKPNFTRTLGSIFNFSMKSILKKENPDLIVCTHGFPSTILNSLKRRRKCSIPVVNIYTDFFINNFWGTTHIEYHFVSTNAMLKIIKKRNLKANIYITGIPIDKAFMSLSKGEKEGNNILITGGSGGYGGIDKILSSLSNETLLKFTVLCGSNNKLFNRLSVLNNKKITPLKYINSTTEICSLYDKADLVIGKPGGITITECLNRGCLFYIHSCLPGQEYYNYNYLLSKGLIIDGLKHEINEDRLISLIKDEKYKDNIKANTKQHLKTLTDDAGDVLSKILRGDYLTQKVGG